MRNWNNMNRWDRQRDERQQERQNDRDYGRDFRRDSGRDFGGDQSRDDDRRFNRSDYRDDDRSSRDTFDRDSRRYDSDSLRSDRSQRYGRDLNYDRDQQEFGSDRYREHRDTYEGYGYGYGGGPSTWSDYGFVSDYGSASPRRYGSNFNDNEGRSSHSDSFRAAGNFGRSYGSTAAEREIDERRSGYAGRGPKGWRRSDDRIKDDVCEALEHHPEVDASDIEVDVKDGMVILKGNVEDRRQKRMAEDVIDQLQGVHDVKNELSINKSFFERARDLLTGEESSDMSDSMSSSRSADSSSGSSASRSSRKTVNPAH